ncbi:hypothetical protein OOU_Y34scaffold01053g2 [Pyricularia oryzae Y34]|uniref:Uncharacterized protein n=1 Tax=Pyricularia oryzae (strain Y34) TaxID=1143189 RepID=A0AA97NMB2_PYRO3|nr:hypothetical protein OOU_Y34scaffold01053g2 [Pyricularia oryzae Y34]
MRFSFAFALLLNCGGIAALTPFEACYNDCIAGRLPDVVFEPNDTTAVKHNIQELPVSVLRALGVSNEMQPDNLRCYIGPRGCIYNWLT